MRVMRKAAFIMIAVCLVASVVAIAHGVSEHIVQAVDESYLAAVNRTFTTGEAIHPEEKSAWLTQLSTAAALMPKNAAMYEVRARVFDVAVKGEGISHADFLEAREALKQALVLRPSSGYAWANLAAIEYRLMPPNALSPRFRQALVHSVKFGPWEREASMGVVDHGLATWDELSLDEKSMIREAVARLAYRYTEDVIAIATKRGKLKIVCVTATLPQHKSCKNIDAPTVTSLKEVDA